MGCRYLDLFELFFWSKMMDYICQICGEEFESIYAFHVHRRSIEKISAKNYYDKFIKSMRDGICTVCECPTEFACFSRGYREFCSQKCSNIGNVSKRKETCLNRYGVDNPSKSKSIREKTKQTCIERYGVENPFKSGEIQDKCKATMMEKYGAENPSLIQDFKDKREQTFIEKFGTNNPWKNEEVKEKIRTTNKLRYGFECSALNAEVKQKKTDTVKREYGVDHYSKTKEYKEKIVKTCQDKYGVDNVFQSEVIKAKSKETSLNKYGKEFPYQSEEVKEKGKQTMIDKYGVDNYSKTDEFRELARNLLINDIEQRLLNGEPLGPRIGEIERECLNSLADVCNYEIKRQFRMNGFFLDGYISELNLAVEFYEKWHEQPKHSARDEYREDFLRRKSNCKFFIVLEKNWLYNRDAVIDEFKNAIANTKE